MKNVQYLLLFLILLPAETWCQDKAHLIGSQDVLTLSIYAGGELQQEVDLTVSDKNMVNPSSVRLRQRSLQSVNWKCGLSRFLKGIILSIPRCIYISRDITVSGTPYRWKEK